MGFAILSGAGLFQGSYANNEVHVHRTTQAYSSAGEIDLTDALNQDEKICPTAPIFVVQAEEDGSIEGTMLENLRVDEKTGKKLLGSKIPASKSYFVDYYVVKPSSVVDELQIDAENFGGYYYVEASTLFRRQNDGFDMPAELTFPNVKVQSNFTFSMASTGDPSTFSFTMDAFPGYTYFEPRRKVLCAIQIINDPRAASSGILPVFPHDDAENISEANTDSVSPFGAVSLDMQIDLGDDNKKAGDLLETVPVISDTGHVTATMKKVSSWSDFSSNPSEQNGFYFPVTVDVPGAKKMKLEKSTTEHSDYSEGSKDVPYDPVIVARVGKETGEQIINSLRVTFYDDNSSTDSEHTIGTYELHFDDVTFKDAQS